MALANMLPQTGFEPKTNHVARLPCQPFYHNHGLDNFNSGLTFQRCQLVQFVLRPDKVTFSLYKSSEQSPPSFKLHKVDGSLTTQVVRLPCVCRDHCTYTSLNVYNFNFKDLQSKVLGLAVMFRADYSQGLFRIIQGQTQT